LTGYQKYRHGEGVAIGMISAMEIANQLGMVTKEEVKKQQRLIADFELATTFGKLKIEEIIAKTKQDKKVKDGKVRFILPEKIGQVKIVSDISKELLKDVLKAQQDY